MRFVQRVAVVILIVAVPLFLITTNLRVVINSGWLYTYGFDKYDIAARTGIEKPELRRISREIKGYFNSPRERLDIRAVVDGRERDLFKEREILHMQDVKGLVRGVGFWQLVSFFSIVGVAVGSLLLLGRRRALSLLAKGLLGGSVQTLGILVALGVVSVAGFDTLFTRFHLISFSNDFWLLDPNTHKLIQMFPQGFFLDATLIIAGLTLGQAALTGAVAGLFMWRGRRARKAAAVLSAAREPGA